VPNRGDDIVWPDKGRHGGAPGPIALSVQLWESDQGNADKAAQVTNAVLLAAGLFPPTVWINSVPNIVREELIGFIADGIMGSRTILFSQRRLDDMPSEERDVLRANVPLQW
jgi:hypothetical protein